MCNLVPHHVVPARPEAAGLLQVMEAANPPPRPSPYQLAARRGCLFSDLHLRLHLPPAHGVPGWLRGCQTPPPHLLARACPRGLLAWSADPVMSPQLFIWLIMCQPLYRHLLTQPWEEPQPRNSLTVCSGTWLGQLLGRAGPPDFPAGLLSVLLPQRGGGLPAPHTPLRTPISVLFHLPTPCLCIPILTPRPALLVATPL